MLYLKQLIDFKFTPWSVNWILTEISGDSRVKTILFSRNIYKKCNYGFKQYLFIYRLLLLKIIEILDCILKDNQEPFIEPHKDIHAGYPFLLFMYTDIGLIRRKLFFQQGFSFTDFDEIQNLAGDPTTMINTWKEIRPKYVNYKGEIETLFAVNGFKEFHIPVRLKYFLEEIDKALDFQRKQYNPNKLENIRFANNSIFYKDKKLTFKKDSVREKIIKLLVKNIDGISSKEIRKEIELSIELFKTNIRQINKRLGTIDLAIKYERSKKLYLLSLIK